MTSQHTLTSILDEAMALEAGKWVTLNFATPSAARRFMWRLYGARRTMRQKATRDLRPSEPGWGLSPWEEISIHHSGPKCLLVMKIAPEDVTMTKEPVQ